MPHRGSVRPLSFMVPTVLWVLVTDQTGGTRQGVTTSASFLRVFFTRTGAHFENALTHS